MQEQCGDNLGIIQDKYMFRHIKIRNKDMLFFNIKTKTKDLCFNLTYSFFFFLLMTNLSPLI